VNCPTPHEEEKKKALEIQVLIQEQIRKDEEEKKKALEIQVHIQAQIRKDEEEKKKLDVLARSKVNIHLEKAI
jgi:hypothetical protein